MALAVEAKAVAELAGPVSMVPGVAVNKERKWYTI